MLPASAHGKLRKMLEFTGSSRDVADPWYTGDFQATYDDVLAGCQGLLLELEQTGAFKAQLKNKAR